MKFKIEFKNSELKSWVDDGGTTRTFQTYSLCLSVKSKDDANAIAAKITENGGDVSKSIKKNEYNNETTYRINVNCSKFTYNSIDKFGILDIELDNLVFAMKKNFMNISILVKNKIEMVSGYEESESEPNGWACAAPEPKAVQKQEVDMTQVHEPAFKEIFNPLDEQLGDSDLPFN